MTTAPAIASTPAVRASIAAICRVRERIVALPADLRCSPECKTWAVFWSDSRGRYEIQICDECWRTAPTIDWICDADVALLPEAQAELRRQRHGRGSR